MNSVFGERPIKFRGGKVLSNQTHLVCLRLLGTLSFAKFVREHRVFDLFSFRFGQICDLHSHLSFLINSESLWTIDTAYLQQYLGAYLEKTSYHLCSQAALSSCVLWLYPAHNFRCCSCFMLLAIKEFKKKGEKRPKCTVSYCWSFKLPVSVVTLLVIEKSGASFIWATC